MIEHSFCKKILQLNKAVYRSAETLQLLINRSTSGLRRGHSLSRDGKKGKKVLACISEILHQSKGRIGQFLELELPIPVILFQ
jgi:hypothetical protein